MLQVRFLGIIFADLKRLSKGHPKTGSRLRLQLYNILLRLRFLIAIMFTGPVISGQTPVANFTGSPLAGCSPLVVVFQDQSTGGALSWNWNFGNGNTSTLQNPTATYFTPGTYTVSLTVTNTNGSNTLTRNQYITVYEPPTASFTANLTTGCFPLRVQFTDLSTPGAGNTNVGWEWDFGSGNSSTAQHPLATYTSAGSFTVTLKVTNDKGCTRTYSRPNYIVVTPGVTADFTHSQPTVCAAPANISFTDNSSGPGVLSYLWNFGDGNTSIVPSPVHTYNSNGSFTVTLIVSSSAGCIDTAITATPIVIGGYNSSFTAPDSVCVNDLVTFTNTTTPPPINSSWAFGDGGTATTTDATHTYTVPGTYVAWLYNTFGACTDSVPHTIVVSPRPVVDFTAPVTSRCEPPLTVNFQDITSGATGWQWDFGDGNTSTLQNPVHTYSNYGNFTVTLIATNAAGCSDTLARTDYINIRRAAITIPQLPARGCIPFTLTLTPTINSVDVVTSYEWDFGDGGTSTLQNPTYTWMAQGTYTVRLIITTSTGCRDTLTIPDAIRVGSKPVADFTAQPIPVCGRQPVFFTDLSVPADQWLWDFGDGGTSTLQNPSHSYSDTGYFTVTLIATNNGCPDTIVKANYPYVLPPIARFVATANCSNRLQFTFTDQSIAPQSWRWDFGDGNTSTAQNPVHTYPAFGPYTVRLIVTNGTCADTLSQVIQAIDENPAFSANITSGCKNLFVNFTASNISFPLIASYYWDFGDGSVQTTSAGGIGYTYTTSGTFTVMLVTTDLNGCTDTVTRTNYIRVNGPIASFTASNVTGCSGLTTVFNDFSTDDGVNAIVSWQWDFGDGNIQNFSGPPFQHVYDSVGIFTVKLTITDAAGCIDTLTITNLVSTSNPIPDFIAIHPQTCPGGSVFFENRSSPATVGSFWDFGDGNTSTVFSPFHSYTTPGIYTVKLRIQDTNGCADSLIRDQYMQVMNPVASFTVNDSVGSCIPLQIQFTNTSTYYLESFWDFGPGQGTSLLTNPIHYYSVPGVYQAQLIIQSPGGCRDTAYQTITVYDTAGSRVDYTPVSGCKPLAVSLSSFSPGPMVSYFWDFGDGNTQTTSVPNSSHIYTSFGSFLPKVIMEDQTGCLIPLQGLDTVLVIGANAKFGLDRNVFCDTGTVQFIDSTTFNDPVISYTWSFGDGGSSTVQNPIYQYQTPGLYTVQLAIQTQNGCRDTATKLQEVRVVASPAVDIAGDTVVCVNSSLLHSGIFLQADTSTVEWFWNFPNGNTSTQQNPPPQVYTIPGSYIVTATAINSTGCTDTTTQGILVNPLPVVTMPGQMTVQAGFPVTIPATYSPNTISWIWSPAQGLSCTSCPAPDAGPKFNTVYQVYFTDENGCVNTGRIEVIVICKDGNLFVPNTFSPNGDGSNDIFYPRGKGLERVRLLRIFNRWGEVVFEKRDFPINDAASGWNGTYKGKKPHPDVYVYQVEVFCDNGDIIRLNGNIALIQ